MHTPATQTDKLPLLHVRMAWITILAITLSAAAFSHNLKADTLGPQQLIVSTTSSMLMWIKDERDLLRNDTARIQRMVERVLLPHVDTTRAAKLVLGKHWRRASAEQRERFTQEFVDLVMRTYTTALSENVDRAVRQEISYLPLQMKDADDDVMVRTEFNQSTGNPVPVNYRLSLTNGNWQVYDVTVAGISLVLTYRKTFASEIKRGSIDKLIERLARHNKKRQEISAARQSGQE